MNYWKECIKEALEDAKLPATEEQIELITSWVEGAHDNFGMAHGHDCIPHPIEEENRRLTNLLKTERDLVYCKECDGTGRIVCYGPYHSSDSPCDKCNGSGKHSKYI
jgi:DnaJ-class molecular chaperone